MDLKPLKTVSECYLFVFTWLKPGANEMNSVFEVNYFRI